jgi:hypothetical protein
VPGLPVELRATVAGEVLQAHAGVELGGSGPQLGGGPVAAFDLVGQQQGSSSWPGPYSARWPAPQALPGTTTPQGDGVRPQDASGSRLPGHRLPGHAPRS